MGVDACFVIGATEKLKHPDLKKLQFDLMHRFGKNLFYGSEEEKDFIKKLDRNYYELQDPPPYLYEIDSLSRYYGQGYARGPGLTIAAVLLYLNRKGFDVFYGGDCSDELPKVDLRDSQELLDYYLDNGNMGYSISLSRDDDMSVLCDYCEQPMERYGWGGNYAAYICKGCDRNKEFRDGKEVTKP